MQIEKKYCYSTLPAFAAVSRGTTVAEEHAAFFPTQLALARWTRGGDVPHVQIAEPAMPMRAAWYTQAQQDFQAWLDAGGFHQAHPYSQDGLPAASVAARCAADDRAARATPVPGIDVWNAPEGKQ